MKTPFLLACGALLLVGSFQTHARITDPHSPETVAFVNGLGQAYQEAQMVRRYAKAHQDEACALAAIEAETLANQAAKHYFLYSEGGGQQIKASLEAGRSLIIRSIARSRDCAAAESEVYGKSNNPGIVWE